MAAPVNWNYLPDNILVKIFSSLSRKSQANASATCKTWRQAFFTPCLWDNIQLCYDPNHGWEQCKKFTSAYGWIFRRVAVFPLLFRLSMFDANGFLIHDAAKEYEKAVKELPNLLELIAASKRLQRLQIKFPDDVMGSWGDDFGIDFFPDEILERIWQSICSILKSSSCIESLELGFHIDIFGTPNRLEQLKDLSSQTLKTLHCTALDCTYDPINSFYPPSVENFTAFKKLREIHLNISFVTDDVLKALSSPDRCPLEHLRILSTCIEKEVQDVTWTADATWLSLKEHSPDLQVSISIYWPQMENFRHWLKPVIPLYHLSIVCDDESLDPGVVRYLRSHFKDMLISLGFHCSSALSLFEHERIRLYSQPLVELVACCQQLKKVVITGFEIFYEDIISVAETRKDLLILDIAHDSIIYMDPERGDRSSDLGVDWIPPRENHEESQDERENQDERDCRKIHLIDRVSNAFQKKWMPMNRETTAFSYWGFVDDNLLPYEEILDDNDDDTSGRIVSKDSLDDGEVEKKSKGIEEQRTSALSNSEGAECTGRTGHTRDTYVDGDEGNQVSPEERLQAIGSCSKSRGDLDICGVDEGPHTSSEDKSIRTAARQQGDETMRGSRDNKRSSYPEYHHAITLAKGVVAYRVRTK